MGEYKLIDLQELLLLVQRCCMMRIQQVPTQMEGLYSAVYGRQATSAKAIAQDTNDLEKTLQGMRRY